MKLSKNTLLFLRNAATLNTGIVIHQNENVLQTVSSNGDVFFRAKIEEKFPENFCVYNLPEFLSILDLFSSENYSPELTVDQTTITITGKHGSATIVQSNPEQIFHVPQGKNMPDIDSLAEFVLTQEMYDTIKATKSTLSHVTFNSSGQEVSMKLMNIKDPTTTVLNFPLGDAKKSFNAVCTSDQFVSVLKVEKGYNTFLTEKFVKLSSQDDSISYWFPLDESSKME